MNYRKITLTFLVIFYLECIYHFFVFQTVNTSNFIYIVIFTFMTSLFIDLITNMFNHQINKWLYLGVITFIALLFSSQFINYQFYGNVISIYSIFNGGQVFGFFQQILAVINNNVIPIILFFLPAGLIMIFNRRLLIFDMNYRYFSYKLIFFIILYSITLLSLNFDKQEIYSANNIYYYKHVPNQTAQTLGLMTTMRLDIQRLLTNFEETVTVMNEEEPDLITEEVTYNMLEIDFNSLTENETNNTIKSIHSYMAGSTPTKQNDYTGYFAGKNLIAIVAEAFSPIAVDPNLTPTLYKLVNNGFVFNNFYTPVYYVSTSDGEYVSLTSLLPKESTWSMYKSSSTYLPYAYGNVFNSLGYITNAYHNGTYTYYNRHKSHPNMGYKFMGCGNGLQKLMNCKKWPQSDIEMIEATFEMYANNEQFMTYYMTISGHLEYNFFGNNMAYKNKALVNELTYSAAVKAYIATQIELDRALELLISKLEAKGILDDTVIVLSADHYPYGLKTNEIKEGMNVTDEKFDVHKNHLIIWHNLMSEPIIIDKHAESLDVVPTVLNLFGIPYDSRLLMGKDILSDTPGIVIFNDRSWITSYGKYNAATREFTAYSDKALPENYIEEINNEVYNKYVISKNILETNYYKKVLKEA